MREALIRRNEELCAQIKTIISLASTASVVLEQQPYKTLLLTAAGNLLVKAQANLELLRLGQISILADVLSETSTLLQWARLLNFRYLRALYRPSQWDRICLRTITWLHKEHDRTREYPAVFTDDDISVIPSFIPLYFFPCLEQRGLRFQPLLFHEFGHLLYQCHKPEMDALVGTLQQTVESELLPASQRNDLYAQEQTRYRQSVVDTWYKWTQEFFCDAVGLVIGGPSYINAFSDYISKLRASDHYRQPSDLRGSTHPVSYLRMRLLIERAKLNGFAKDAERISTDWAEAAKLLRINEDYHGFYTASLQPALTQTIDDMLTETSPRRCTLQEAAGAGWQSAEPNLIALLNQAWLNYLYRPAEFHAWEALILDQVYGLK